MKHTIDPQAPYVLKDAGENHVDVLDRGGNPVEYNVDRATADREYGARHSPDDMLHDWRQEVVNGDTRLGFGPWCDVQLEALAGDDDDGLHMYVVQVTTRSIVTTRFRLEAKSEVEALRIIADSDMDDAGIEPDREDGEVLDEERLMDTAKVERVG